ncbi:l-ascorbate oxidase [Colletotrichum truncatum]|uniref:L-ascorbate oxidase n=1 Tax=Colletotrichum truncatum TaxID=5467 RepID=A0ACC3ZD98_COLTU|nr:l-ascorbate oxidase [Colletotrichum truncatum]KAF6798036.1 l-ascorbate oxidase [Colletotrichum truncatum]
MLSFVSVLCFVVSLTQVGAWAPRTSGHGAPGHYGGTHEHGAAFTPDHVLRVTYENISIGCQTRMSAVVNGSLHGPTLRLRPGRRSWIRVYNDMEEYNTTMHWHGLSMRMAPFSDGTPAASQWPIPAGRFFDYEVYPLKSEAGTYFYHSHVGFQAMTASGPLIVEDKAQPPYAYDEERIISFSDYFNKTDHQIEKGLTATPFVWSGETNAVLINGVGVSIGETGGKGDCKLPVIDVEPGKTYRLRFIGATAISLVQMGIVNHENFTIIAADGSYTKPHSERFMQVSTGQRFDVIFKAKSEEELGGTTDFLIQFETKDRPKVYHGYGILRYSKAKPQITEAPTGPPLKFSNETYSWAEYALEPLKPNNFPKASEVTRRVHIDSRQLTSQSIIWQMNGLEWNETSSPYAGDKPYLINIYENGPAAIPNYTAAVNNNGWDPTTLTWPAKLGEVLEIVLHNTGSLVNGNGGVDFHPFHAHGGHYWDIGSGNGTYNATENEKKLENYNPVRRDTTNLYRYGEKTTSGANAGWRAWRLRVEDAGVWMIHCHILQHMVMGMQSVWVMGDYQDITGVPFVDAAGYLEYGGNATGNTTFAPRVVLYSAGSAIYNIFFHPLRHYPGPRLWAASRLPWNLVNLKGNLAWKIRQLHDSYGPIVRIAPDELSYTSSSAWKKIYGQRSPEFVKCFDGRGIAGPSVTNPAVRNGGIVTADQEPHARLRKAVLPAFSDRALKEQEEILQLYASKLVNQLRSSSRSGAPQDLGKWFSLAAFDIISDLAFGQAAGCLDDASQPWLQVIGTRAKSIVRYQFAIHYGLEGWLEWLAPKAQKAALKKHGELAAAKVKKRLQQTENKKDFMSYILENPQADLSNADLVRMASAFIVAGSGTTSTALSGITYLLCSNSDKHIKLTQEIRNAFSKEEEITISSTGELRYLKAVIEEALRIYPPSPSALPRFVPGAGEEIDGKWVPGGTAVGVHQLSAGHSKVNWTRSGEFIPERWMDSSAEFNADDKPASQPFSFGPRNCIGKSMAYAELRIVMAKLLWEFDLELIDGSQDWMDEQKVYLIWQKVPLLVRCRSRF